MGDGLCCHGSQHHVTSFKENNGLGFPSVRGVNQAFSFPRFPNESLDWLLIYGQKSEYPIYSDDIAKTDVN
jgi:hypothetical protein